MTVPSPDTRWLVHRQADDELAPHCLHCGLRNNAHTTRYGDGEERPPRPGDFCVCIHCRSVAVYTSVLGHLALRAPTAAERAEFDREHAAASAGTVDALRVDLARAGLRPPQEGPQP